MKSSLVTEFLNLRRICPSLTAMNLHSQGVTPSRTRAVFCLST